MRIRTTIDVREIIELRGPDRVVQRVCWWNDLCSDCYRTGKEEPCRKIYEFARAPGLPEGFVVILWDGTFVFCEDVEDLAERKVARYEQD